MLRLPPISTQWSGRLQRQMCIRDRVVTHTVPGAAPLIARLLDSCGKPEGILGTIAGDDTIFIVPVAGFNVGELQQTVTNILQTNHA